VPIVMVLVESDKHKSKLGLEIIKTLNQIKYEYSFSQVWNQINENDYKTLYIYKEMVWIQIIS
jgi:hypothetical protein